MATATAESIESTATSGSPASGATTAARYAAGPQAVEVETLRERRRLLLLVRTGLTLALGYLLIFSSASLAPSLGLIAFALCYLGSNVVIALLPIRILARAEFDFGLILTDTAVISAALLLIPDTRNDMLVFYFTIMLLASITDRMMLSMLAPIITSGAYVAFLLARDGLDSIMQPAILLRLPFFLLAGTFYGFFVERARRGQAAVASAKQRMQARSELLMMITHDLKQPLWVATQSAAMLYDQIAHASASTRELAAEVMVSLKRMESLTLNFLDLGKMESRGLRASPRRTSLNRLVEDVINAYRPALELRGMRAQVDLGSDLPAAWIDPLPAERCLANLFDNAIKYTPGGGVITCRTAADGDWVTITVGDSGPGIDPERAATLFARFQDGADAVGRRSTGLGLYIVHALVESLGGEIALDTHQSPGAWFRIRLPTARPGVEVAKPLRGVAHPVAQAAL